MTSLTRGPLPARVYWVRRLLVLGIALTLVAGIGWLLGRGSDASDETARASRVSAEPADGGATDATPQVAATEAAEEPAQKAAKKAAKKRKKKVLAEPRGTCDNTDVAVTPVVKDAVAGRDVVVTLKLRTLEAPACTWRVTPDEVSLKITSGSDDIWSSRECPAVVPTEDVVLRSNAVTRVPVTWNSRRSDEDCSALTDWARPGWYHATAAALAGEPVDHQFELGTPTAPVVTRTVTPEPEPSTTAKPDKKQKNRAASEGQ